MNLRLVHAFLILMSAALAVLFGTDALSYRLENSGASALITNARGAERIAEIRKDLPALGLVLSLDGPSDGALAFADLLA